jgi:DeoR family deoxyribose operon repressor
MDKKQERIGKIMRALKIYQTSSIRELAAQMQVSEMTIRRDLHTLSRENTVKVLHGGVILSAALATTSPASIYSLVTEETLKIDEKKRIGQKAASLIEPQDIIIIDSGSTTEYLAKFIPEAMPITVLCYSLNNLFEVSRKKIERIIFAGGYFHGNIMMFESAEGAELIRKNRANKAFLAARGVSEKLGITTANQYEIEMKKAALKSSLCNILLIDSSKFGQVGSAHYADLRDVNVIITDSGIPQEYVDLINSLGIQLHIV